MRVLRRDIPCAVRVRFDDGEICAFAIDVDTIYNTVRLMYDIGTNFQRDVPMRQVVQKGPRLSAENLLNV